MAVVGRAGRNSGTDIAAGTGAVVDDDLLAQQFAELVADDACDGIIAAAGGLRHDNRNGLGGIFLLCERAVT